MVSENGTTNHLRIEHEIPDFTHSNPSFANKEYINKRLKDGVANNGMME